MPHFTFKIHHLSGGDRVYPLVTILLVLCPVIDTKPPLQITP